MERHRRGKLGVATIFSGTLLLFIVFGATPTADAREKWGPFRGQVVDLETGAPIAGAVVLALWWENEPNPIQPKQKFYEAKEAVTDASGRFEIPRLPPPFFTFQIFDPQFTVFAPAYVWRGTLITPKGGERFVDPTVIEMRPLKTREELWKKSRAWPVMVPLDKMPEFIKAVNAERQMLGLPPEGRKQR